MPFKFKKQIFGFMDLIRFTKMVPKRREKLAEGSAEKIPATSRVTDTEKILRPGYRSGNVIKKPKNSADTKTYEFETESPFYFRAGQYMTLGTNVNGSEVSRPYAVSSAPKAALDRHVAFTVKKCGFFSGYLFDNATVGDMFTVGDPSGEFCYEPVKDARHIVGIAGGSGITPFYSMAQAIADGTIDLRLTILYGAKTEEDLIFKNELDALKCDKIDVVYVLSDEQKEGYESGFIGADVISEYVSGDFTVMMCGPQAMYAFLDKELKKFGLPLRRIKKEAITVGLRDVT